MKLIILTAPSGAGKTSIAKHLMRTFPDKLAFSVSATTRMARSTEKHGIEYYFISEEDFKKKIEQQEFIEWEMVYEGKYYGTLKSEIQRIWNEGHFPVLDIDVKGAIHVQQQFPGEVLSLFIQPPSVEELRRRLESRGTDSAETINTRIKKAAYEISFNPQFSHIILNEELEKACAEAEKRVRDFIAG